MKIAITSGATGKTQKGDLKKTDTVRLVFVPVLLFISCFFFFQCQKKIEERPEMARLIVDPEVEVADSVVISRIDTLGLTFRIVSPLMIRTFHNRTLLEEHPNGFEVFFYNNKHQTGSKISAGYAHIDHEQSLATLEELVKIESENGDILETSDALWNTQYGTLRTDKFIRLIEAAGDTTYGFGLEANQDFTRFKIKNGFAAKRQFQNIMNKLTPK